MSLTRTTPPYLVFLGGVTNPLDAKTGRGLKDWRPQLCIGQLRHPGCTVDLGLPDMSPAQAVAAGARSLVIGVAPSGGRMNPDWLASLCEALEAGLHLVSGMHSRLESVPELAQAASRHGRDLINLRVPPPDIPLGTGRKRSGKRLLTVGTDCCVGKKYTALALEQGLRQAGVPATFRASGQTGLLIAGQGIPLDAVVSDFLAGAAEQLSPDNADDHWDLIEGQGSLFHPAYAAVTLGLVHGSQPDALVLCHEAGRQEIDEYPGYPIPSLEECMNRYLEAARLTNPAVRVVGISVNTSSLPAEHRSIYLQALAAQCSLPCVDPLVEGVDSIIEELTREPGE